jgi:hypothetical protein
LAIYYDPTWSAFQSRSEVCPRRAGIAIPFFAQKTQSKSRVVVVVAERVHPVMLVQRNSEGSDLPSSFSRFSESDLDRTEFPTKFLASGYSEFTQIILHNL